VPDLIVGDYETQVKMKGFQTSVQRNIALTVGNERVIDFTLQVGWPTGLSGSIRF
jgi:hypothetical protein